MYVIVNTQNSMEQLEDEPRKNFKTSIKIRENRPDGSIKIQDFQHLTGFF